MDIGFIARVVLFLYPIVAFLAVWGYFRYKDEKIRRTQWFRIFGENGKVIKYLTKEEWHRWMEVNERFHAESSKPTPHPSNQ